MAWGISTFRANPSQRTRSKSFPSSFPKPRQTSLIMSSDSSLAPRPVFIARPAPSSSTSSSRNVSRPRSLDSLLAGGLAGAVEGLVTFPTDLCKTRLQLVQQQEARKASSLVIAFDLLIELSGQAQGLIAMMKAIYLKGGFKGFYAGAPPVVVGNAVKSCVRFASYERFKALLRGNDVSLARPKVTLTEILTVILSHVRRESSAASITSSPDSWPAPLNPSSPLHLRKPSRRA